VAVAIGAGLNMAGIDQRKPEASPLIYWSWFRAVALACLLGLCSLAFDYGAIRLAVEDGRKSVRAYLRLPLHLADAVPHHRSLHRAWLVVLFSSALTSAFPVGPADALALIFLLFLNPPSRRPRQGLVPFYSAQCALYQTCVRAPCPRSRHPNLSRNCSTLGPEPEPLKEPVPRPSPIKSSRGAA
jgi:hypothetical protein